MFLSVSAIGNRFLSVSERLVTCSPQKQNEVPFIRIAHLRAGHASHVVTGEPQMLIRYNNHNHNHNPPQNVSPQCDMLALVLAWFRAQLRADFPISDIGFQSSAGGDFSYSSK